MKKRFCSICIPAVLLVTLAGCGKAPEWLTNWQQKQIEKRYGTKVSEPTIEKWQKEAKDFESEIEKKVNAGSRAAIYYRQLGMAFAEYESFSQCTENLGKAIELGIYDAEVFYYKGLCEANLAQRHNWQYEYALEAEKSFLKALNVDEKFGKPKYQLGIIYFHGMGRNNRYRVLDDYITVNQEDYRVKGIELMQEYVSEFPGDLKGYFAISQMYAIQGEKNKAREALQQLLLAIEKESPQDFQKREDYKQAQQNLNLLGP